LVSEEYSRGVSPAQQANWCGEPNRVTSPISAMNTAANIRPIPLTFNNA
jgi:hypothetical protein